MIVEVLLYVLAGSWMFSVAMLIFYVVAKMLGYEGIGRRSVVIALLIASLWVYGLSTPLPGVEGGVEREYGIPEHYYVNNGIVGEKTLEDLEGTLKRIEMPHKYEPYVFDCSEMSAYVEWYLENRGYNATLVGTDRHAQVVVYDVSGRAYVIGCTLNPPRVMGYKTDFTYKNEWEDIYSACAYNRYEWDWWKKVGNDYSPIDRRGAGTNKVNVGDARR